MKTGLLKSEKGSVLLAAVVITLILTILGISVLSVANSEIAAARKDVNKTKSFYLAEAGVARLTANVSSGNFANIGETSLGCGSYDVNIYNDNWNEPCAVATGEAGGETAKVQVTVSYLIPPYECGIYAAGLNGGNWTLVLRGEGDPCTVYSGGKSVGDFNGKDIIYGNIFADGNVAMYGQSKVDEPTPNPYDLDGDVNVTGGISVNESAFIAGDRITNSTPMSPPDLVGMNYAVNNTHDVAKIFRDAGVTRGAPPAGNSLYDVFQINPNDRNTENTSTDGNDYYLDLHPGSSSYVGGAWNTAPTPINVGTNKVYYIDGNLWVNSKNDTFGYNMSGKASIVVTGNIYICDNLKYADTSSMLGLVALGKYNSSGQRVSGGDIIFGDPAYGTMYTFSGMMFAANNFLYNARSIGTFSKEPESGFILNGSMAALNQISLERDWYTSSGSARRPARFDPSTSQWYDSGTGAVLTSAQVGTMKHYRMILNYDDRIRVVGTQPPALPRGMGRIFCGLTSWKALP